MIDEGRTRKGAGEFAFRRSSKVVHQPGYLFKVCNWAGLSNLMQLFQRSDFPGLVLDISSIAFAGLSLLMSARFAYT